MSEERFAQLLKASVPDPPSEVSVDEVIQKRDRRRRAVNGAVVLVAAVATVAAGAWLPGLLRNRQVDVGKPVDGLSVAYHGVTFKAPTGWQLGEAPMCHRPADKSVVVGPGWDTGGPCHMPASTPEPTWVWLTQFTPNDISEPLQSSRDGRPFDKLIVDGQPAWLSRQDDGERYVLTFPWLGVHVAVGSPNAEEARSLVDRVSATPPDGTLAVPADADEVFLQAVGNRKGKVLTGQTAAQIIEELRALPIRTEPDGDCATVRDKKLAGLTVYGPGGEYRTYIVRGGSCTETYGGTGVAGETTLTLRTLIDEQL
jgi:hypothetical protein